MSVNRAIVLLLVLAVGSATVLLLVGRRDGSSTPKEPPRPDITPKPETGRKPLSTLTPLLAAWKGENDTASLQVVAAEITKLGDAGQPAIEGFMKEHPTPLQARALARTFGILRRPEHVQYLRVLLSGDKGESWAADMGVKRDALRALTLTGGTPAVEVIAGNMNVLPSDLLGEAEDSLATIATVRDVASLQSKAGMAKTPVARDALMRAAGRVVEKENSSSRIEQIRKTDSESAPAIAALLKEAQDKSTPMAIRLAAIEKIGQSKSPESLLGMEKTVSGASLPGDSSLVLAIGVGLARRIEAEKDVGAMPAREALGRILVDEADARNERGGLILRAIGEEGGARCLAALRSLEEHAPQALKNALEKGALRIQQRTKSR